MLCACACKEGWSCEKWFSAQQSDMAILFLAFSFLVLLSFYIFYKFGYAPYQVLQRCGIKGPKPTPFFGNYLEIRKLGKHRFKQSLYERYGSICGYYVGQLPCIMVLDLAVLKQIMVIEHCSFMNRRQLYKLSLKVAPDGVLFSQGKLWKYRRDTITPAFSAAKMKLMVPLLENSIETLIEVLGKIADTEKSLEIYETLESFTLEVIFSTCFGRVIDVQNGENNSLIEATADLFKTFKKHLAYTDVLLTNFPWLDSLGAYFIKPNPSYALLLSAATSLVNVRRKENGHNGKKKDFLQLLVDAIGEETVDDSPNTCIKRQRKLTDKEVALISLDFLIGGHKSTASTFCFATYLLAVNPDVQQKLQKEIDSYYGENPDASLQDGASDINYLDMVLLEVLRIYPVGNVLGRMCNKTTTIGDVTFPKGAMAVIPLQLLHHDERFWPDPEKFDPMRFTAEEKAKRPQLSYMPFGFGPRSCIGMRFALMEAKMTLIGLLKKFTFLSAPDTEIPLQIFRGIALTPANGVYLNVKRRQQY